MENTVFSVEVGSILTELNEIEKINNNDNIIAPMPITKGDGGFLTLICC